MTVQYLNLPTFDWKVQHSAAGLRIFDVVRKKFVRLTPEEWTRQHFVHYLIHQLAYPKSLIRLEGRIKHSHRQHRPDIVVFNRAGKPQMLVECKSPHIAVDASTWHQLARYNPHLQAQLLVITNGMQHYCWQVSYNPLSYQRLQAIPHANAVTSVT
ncbi:MAG: type I restriction enzyme HsdR N-terminal domain-containing protein [Bacteroidota bacterium]